MASTLHSDIRTRKEKILDNISIAVKKIQREYLETNDLTYQNEDASFCRLVEQFDHAFRHRLRHHQQGYWKFIGEFTHSSIMREIRLLDQIVTDLGRSRAWLYRALQDRLLESYLSCFGSCQKVLKKCYTQGAIMLDQECLTQLITLVSCLENVEFQLEKNVAYLDVCSCIKPPPDDDFDNISLCSVSSTQSTTSDALTTDESDVNSDHAIPMPPAWLNEEMEMDPSEPVEVIQFKRNGQRRRGTRTSCSEESSAGSYHGGSASPMRDGLLANGRRRRAERDSGCEMSPRFPDLQHLLSPKLKTIARGVAPSQDGRNALANAFQSIEESEAIANRLVGKNRLGAADCEQDDGDGGDGGGGGGGGGGKASPSSAKTGPSRPDVPTKTLNSDLALTPDRKQVAPDSESSLIDFVSCATLPGLAGIDCCCVGPQRSASAVSWDQWTAKCPAKFHKRISAASEGLSSPEEPSIYDSEINQSCETVVTLSRNGSVVELCSHSPRSLSPSRQSLPSRSRSHSGRSRSGSGRQNSAADFCGEVAIGLNVNLLLKLHVLLEGDEEQPIKLYRCYAGPSTAVRKNAHFLISTSAAYILVEDLHKVWTQECSPVVCAVPFKTISHVSLGMNRQFVHIVCHNRRRQFWVQSAEEELTRSMVVTLERAMAAGGLGLAVLSDATTQRISMCKWLTSESVLPAHHISVLHYCLAHWRPVLPPTRSASPFSPTQLPTSRRQGYLTVKTQSSFLGFTSTSWSASYFVLRDGLLSRYHCAEDAAAAASPVSALDLRADCVGCCRLLHSPRPHSLAVSMRDETQLELAAGSAAERQMWLQSICLAVSSVSDEEDVFDDAESPLACSVVLTSDKLFLAHENVLWCSYRTISSLSIEDIRSIKQAESGEFLLTSILVLEVKCKQSSVKQWILYLQSPIECHNLREAIATCWQVRFNKSVKHTNLSYDPDHATFLEEHRKLKQNIEL